MKLLVVVGSLNLSWRWAMNPYYWQLLKGLHGLGSQVIVVPWAGSGIASPWWHSLDNPSKSFFAGSGPNSTFRFLGHAKNVLAFDGGPAEERSEGVREKVSNKGPVQRALALYLATRVGNLRKNWAIFLRNISRDFKGIDAVMFWGVPLNELHGLPELARRILGVPVTYYLVEPEEFSKSHRLPAQRVFPPSTVITEFDLVHTISKGAIPYLYEAGVERAEVVYVGVDPGIYMPLDISSDIDVSFYGHSVGGRERQFEFMVVRPSLALPSKKFVVAGENFRTPMGHAKFVGSFPISFANEFYSRSKINLNITRRSVAEIYGTSNLRLFELAALGCCIVSDHRAGIEEWFEPGRDLVVVHDFREAFEAYNWLLSSEEARTKLGDSARAKVLGNHTASQRAAQLLTSLQRLTNQKQS